MLWILDLLVLRFGLCVICIFLCMSQSPRLSTFCGVLGQSSMRQSMEQALAEARLEVPRLIQLLMDPRVFKWLLNTAYLLTTDISITCLMFSKYFLSSHHTSLHRVVRSFDLGDVQKACWASSEHSTWEVELRNGMEASFVEAPGAVRYALTSLKYLLDFWMSLQSLEFFIRVKVWILIIKTNY